MNRLASDALSPMVCRLGVQRVARALLGLEAPMIAAVTGHTIV